MSQLTIDALAPTTPWESGPASDPDIEGAVDRIVQVHRGATLQLALDVGAIVVEKLYGGDLELLRSKGRKDVSLRKLASHPRLPFSAATLWRCIGVYAVVRRFPETVRYEHLSVGHFRAVLMLPSDAQQDLLRRAAEEKRSVGWISNEAAAMKATTIRKSRTRATEKCGVVANVRRVEESVLAHSISAADESTRLGGTERDQIAQGLRAVWAWCEAVEELLAR